MDGKTDAQCLNRLIHSTAVEGYKDWVSAEEKCGTNVVRVILAFSMFAGAALGSMLVKGFKPEDRAFERELILEEVSRQLDTVLALAEPNNES